MSAHSAHLSGGSEHLRGKSAHLFFARKTIS